MASPTSRTLEWLRKQRLEAQVVERWNQWAKIRQDLFGIIDIVSVGQSAPISGWQATAMSCLSARVKKAMEEPRLIEWLRSGGRFYCIGWGKRGGRGKRKGWAHRVIEFKVHGQPLRKPFLSHEEIEYPHSDTCMCIDCIPTERDPEETE